MGISEHLTNVIVRKAAELLKKDSEDKITARSRSRGSIVDSVKDSGKQASFPAGQTGAGTLEEADRMLQEITDMVRMAARYDRNAAKSKTRAAGIKEMPDPTALLFPLGDGETGSRPESTNVAGVETGVEKGRSLPRKTFAEAQTMYNSLTTRNGSTAGSVREAPEAADEVDTLSKSDTEHDEAASTRLDLTV